MKTTKTTTRRNTFSRQHGSTFKCDVCGRGTRHTGVQSMGSKTCPQCYDLAGIENEISDGHCEPQERQALVAILTNEITVKGGSLVEWQALIAKVNAPTAEAVAAEAAARADAMRRAGQQAADMEPTPTRTRAEYDAAQTAKCNALSVALGLIEQRVRIASHMDPAGDNLVDTLRSIADDLDRATRLSAALNRDDVFAEIS